MPGLLKQLYGNTSRRKQRWTSPVPSHDAKLTRYLLALFIVALAISPASATDFGICCMKAAREQFNVTIFDTPWSVCGVDPPFDFTKDTPLSGSVNASLGWCKEHCGGFQASSTSQWLGPLATWVIPAFTLLILCSIGEEGRKNKIPFSGLLYWVREYLSIIGDPVSAISGGFAELWVDAWLARKISNKKEDGTEFREIVVGLAMIAIQTKFEDPTTVNYHRSNNNTTSGEEDTESKGRRNNDQMETAMPRGEITPLSTKPADVEKNVVISTKSFDDKKSLDDEKSVILKGRITTVLKSRIDFINGITLPVVLALVTTASVFYGAYQTLGDNDTADGLAFGIWYAWVIVLAVVSNSAVASVDPGVAAAAVSDLLHLSRRTVPLRERMRSTTEWRDWVVRILGEEDASRSLSFFVRYLGGPLVAWVMVAFFCACAATISYNTPTVGIGCQSFSFILYGSLAAVTALVMMLRNWDLLEEGRSKIKTTKTKTQTYLDWTYYCLVGLTAFVLTFSTLAQVIGLYRSCVCNHFGPLSSPLELATGTKQSIDFARRTWIPIGFVAYTCVWLVCGVVVGIRTYISFHIQKFLGE